MTKTDWKFGDWALWGKYVLRVCASMSDGVVKAIDEFGSVRCFNDGSLEWLPECDSFSWKPPVNPGDGWRLLCPEEEIEEGDEFLCDAGRWVGSLNWTTKCRTMPKKYPYRRRVTPPLQLREGAWYERRDGKVVGPCTSRVDKMYPWRVACKWYTNSGRYEAGNTEPCIFDLIREVPDPSPKPSYRPFANAEEYKPFRDMWVRTKEDGGRIHRIRALNSCGIWFSGIHFTFNEAFRELKFEDGKPFGHLEWK
jgi:hypothetical protein